jgi:membrane-bound metal-dependent hydrolase YbcI (DUF457 family)
MSIPRLWRAPVGIGHLGLAFASKKIVPRVRLGWLLLAGLFLDAVWAVAIASGVEHARIVPGITAASPLDLYDYPFSHSLVAALVWSALFAAVTLWLTKDRLAALVLALGVSSHWLLDVASHRPDVPVFPHGPYWGLGLWNSVPATLLVEAGLLLGGVLVYVRATSARDRIGSLGLWIIVGFFLLGHLGAYLGPPPSSMTAVLIGNAILPVPLLAADWVDRHREAMSPGR